MPNIKDINLINICRNSPDINAIYLAISHDIKSSFILISWIVSDNLWYIPAVLINNQIDFLNTYIQGEPSILGVSQLVNSNNITRGIDSENLLADNISLGIDAKKEVLSNSIMIYNSQNEIDDFYMFIIESTIEKIKSADFKNRYNKRTKLLLSNICHSIRTPLNAILHVTNELVSNTNTDYLNASAITLANSIFDIVDMANLEIGVIKITKELVNISTLIDEVILVAKTLNKKSISIESYVDQSTPEHIYSDKKKIKQILINLLENAIHNTNQGEIALYVSSTWVDLKQENNDTTSDSETSETDIQYSISFVVSDTGMGMDEKTKNSLFKPLEMLSNSKQQGISLRVSYLLAKKLGGSLYLKNSIQNQGSSFEFNIIVYEGETITSNAEYLQNKTVLLIDNSETKIKLCNIMDKYNMIYTIASSYEEVLLLHTENKFDLIIWNTINYNTINYNAINYNNIELLKQTRSICIIDNIVDKTNIFSRIVSSSYDEFEKALLNIFNNEISSQDINILVVEDEYINRIIIEKLLKTKGYKHIDMAKNGLEVIELVASKQYHVILLDIRMPIMSGFELAKKIYETYGKNSPKMIGQTAQMVLDDEPKPYFKEFIYKPIDIDELDKKIKSVLNIQ